MAHFYGTLQGNRGQTTRCGTKSSGITVTASGWHGRIRTSVWRGADGDEYAVYLEDPRSGKTLELLAGGRLHATC